MLRQIKISAKSSPYKHSASRYCQKMKVDKHRGKMQLAAWMLSDNQQMKLTPAHRRTLTVVSLID